MPLIEELAKRKAMEKRDKKKKNKIDFDKKKFKAFQKAFKRSK